MYTITSQLCRLWQKHPLQPLAGSPSVCSGIKASTEYICIFCLTVESYVLPSWSKPNARREDQCIYCCRAEEYRTGEGGASSNIVLSRSELERGNIQREGTVQRT